MEQRHESSQLSSLSSAEESSLSEDIDSSDYKSQAILRLIVANQQLKNVIEKLDKQQVREITWSIFPGCVLPANRHMVAKILFDSRMRRRRWCQMHSMCHYCQRFSLIDRRTCHSSPQQRLTARRPQPFSVIFLHSPTQDLPVPHQRPAASTT